MGWVMLVPLMFFLHACLAKDLAEVRASPPVQTGSFSALPEQMAACTKREIQMDTWPMGQPEVHLTKESRTPLIRVFALYAGTTLFDLTFQPAPMGKTLVQYRRGYDGYDSKEKTWSIMERCSSLTLP